MRSILWLAVVLGCSSETSDVTITITEHEPVEPPRADEATLARLEKQINTGDALKPAVMKVVAVAGPPNIIDTAGFMDWFAAGKDTCSILRVAGDGEFVKRTEHSQFGETADEYKKCRAATKQRAKLPPLPEPRKLDLDKPAREIMAAWRDGAFARIVEMQTAELRGEVTAEEYAHLEKLFEPVAGKLVELGAPLTTETKDSSYIVSGPARFDKGTLTLTLAFRVVDNKLQLDRLDLKLPKELQAKPDDADGEKLARKALDALLAGKLADVLALGSPELIRDVRKNPDGLKAVDKAARAFGRVRSIKLRVQNECNGRSCVLYDVVGAKARGTARMIVMFVVSRWEVAGVNLDPG